MDEARVRAVNNTIRAVRKVFYNTPVMRWKLTAMVYDRVFSMGSHDFSKPIKFRNAKFYVDGKDRSYLPTMVGGYYEKLELDIFEELASCSKTFLDIGANIGMYSVVAASINRSISCFAFEPVRENYSLTTKNVKINHLSDNIEIVKKAVSDKNGKATIFLSESSSGMHSLTVQHSGESREIETVRIDTFCKERELKPDLIKVDVEGHEPSAFAGMQETLNETKPTILMEFLAGVNEDMQKLVDVFDGIYKYCYVVDEIKGTVKKVQLSELKLHKNYNIILSKSKKHIKLIESYTS